MRGALSTMPAEDVLEWVVRRRVSAPLLFERGGTLRSLMVEDGAVVWASSNQREEQLGVILVRSGLVAERALADALETRAETGVPLGKVLLMSGLVSERDLGEILATKICEAVIDIVTWTDGTFELVPRSQPQPAGLQTTIAIENALVIARERTARMLDIMAALGADDVTFYAPPDAAPPDAVPGIEVREIDAARLWALARDRRSARELAAMFGGARFATFDALAAMVAAGCLAIDREGPARERSAIELATAARARLSEGDRAGALALAAAALHRDPSDAEVRKTFSQVERARVAEVAKELLSRHRVPRLAMSLSSPRAAELALTAAERELAARVDGRWDLLSLIRSASVREAEALLAFARLADAGVVELGP